MENQITAAIAAAKKAVSGLTDRDIATILAALRFWQREWDEGPEDVFFEDHVALTSDEIDDLCERLNQ